MINLQVMTKHLPNFITSLNLVSGFFSILFALNGFPLIASWLIIAAMVFDFFDGFSARLLKAYSDTGKELDSLADVVSFGVAPATIIFHYLSVAIGITGQIDVNALSFPNCFLLAVPAIMPVFAAIRLARFNTDDTQKDSFKGLASPASALAVVSLALALECTNSGISQKILGTITGNTILTIVLSFLMVCRLPMISLKFHDMNLKGNWDRYLLIICIALMILLLGFKAAPFMIPIYIAISIISVLAPRK
jgi:CDP-diacylglycerol--serine O-phosphatidyltransferase